MYCISCGKEIRDVATFCSYCGARQEKTKPADERMYCIRCEKEFDPDMMFCDDCGMKLTAKTQQRTVTLKEEHSVAPRSAEKAAAKSQRSAAVTKQEHSADSKNGESLMEIGMASIYHGNKAMGSACFSGTVYLYEDRIETKGMLVNAPDVFVKMEEIAGVSKGTYMILWSSVILRLKNGEEFTIAGATTGAEAIDRAITIINRGVLKATEKSNNN